MLYNHRFGGITNTCLPLDFSFQFLLYATLLYKRFTGDVKINVCIELYLKGLDSVLVLKQ
jgi:hypothetical protein